MRSTWLCWFLLVAAVSAAAAQSVAQGGRPAPAPSGDELRRLFAQLGDEQFQVREQAEQRLQELGPAAIPALEAAALAAEPNLTLRVLRLLERMFIDGCPDVADEAERALERLSRSERPEVMARARVLLAGNHHLRERRAIAAIRELGGKVDFQSLDSGRANLLWGWGGDLGLQIPGQPPVRMHIMLLRDWAGGEEGLWHLARLEDSWSARLWGIDITNVRGNGLSLERVQSLAARLPQAQITERGASLGITCSSTGVCVIGGVIDNGPAARAGIQPRDVVLQIDDTLVTSFQDLVGALLDRDPGERAILKVQRNSELLDIPVTLGSWREVKIGAMAPHPNRPADPEPLLPELKP